MKNENKPFGPKKSKRTKKQRDIDMRNEHIIDALRTLSHFSGHISSGAMRNGRPFLTH